MHPAVTVHSGDTVVMQTLSTCGPTDRLVARGVKAEDVPAYNDEIYKNYPADEKGPGGHILTGPVAIAEAEPGDVLEVQIQKITIDAPFACNGFGLHRGFLPMEFPYGRNRIVPLDREKMIGHFAPGIEIPLRPFFGSMGVAGVAGKIGSTEPFAHAGNMDNKELVAGTTLYLPIHVDGALCELGDPAAAIVERAAAGHYDLLVLASRERGALARALLGSVTEQVIRHAPCPVLTVHPQA